MKWGKVAPGRVKMVWAGETKLARGNLKTITSIM